MGDVRAPAVAGSFYPSRGSELDAEVRRHVAQGCPAREVLPWRAPKAVIAPHAGYVYSGPVAGSAFRALAPLRGRVSRAVVIGPAHRAAFQGLALPEADAFATPLGLMRIDESARAALLELPQVIASDEAHAGEHSLEVELPFLQVVLGDVSIVPIAVGRGADEAVERALERSWAGPETCVVVSSDLSHYYPYASAKSLDSQTARAIEQLSADSIEEEHACGGVGVRALLRVARSRGLHATVLDLRSSGDTAGPRDEVVGYGAFAFA
jgi:AmmeMemoRadiSam system protein B